MSGITSALYVLGALGLVVLGCSLATESVRALVVRFWSTVVTDARRRPGLAYRAGLWTALCMPATQQAARAAIAVGESRASGVAGALLFACGLSAASLVSAWIGVLAAILPGLRELCCLLLIGGAAWRSCSKVPTISARGAWIAGQALVLLGASGLIEGMQALGAWTRLDAWNLGPAARIVLLLALGGTGTVLLRSASVITLLAVASAAGGTLELYSAGALALGGTVAFAWPAGRVLRSGNAEGRRVALGLALHHALLLGVGLLILPWLYALGGLNALAPAARAALVASLLGVSSLVSTLVFHTLSAPISAWLDRAFVEIEDAVGRPGSIAPELQYFPALALEASWAGHAQLGLLVKRVARAVLGETGTSEKVRRAQCQAAEELAGTLDQALERLRCALAQPRSAARHGELVRGVRLARELCQLLSRLQEEASEAYASLGEKHVFRMRQLELLCLRGIELYDGGASVPEAVIHELWRAMQAHARDLRERLLEDFAVHKLGSRQRELLLQRVDALEALGGRGLAWTSERGQGSTEAELCVSPAV